MRVEEGIRSFIHSSTHSLIHSSTHPLIHSFTHSLIHSFNPYGRIWELSHDQTIKQNKTACSYRPVLASGCWKSTGLGMVRCMGVCGLGPCLTLEGEMEASETGM